MDLSEYEVLNQNKKLLEDSLNRERDLASKLEAINKEKIEALEAAQRKVVVINKTENISTCYIKKDSNNIISNLFSLCKNMTYVNASRYTTDIINIINRHDFINSIFDIKTNTSWSESPIITYHGLDDIRKQIYDEIKSEYDNSIIEMTKEYPNLKLKLEEYKLELVLLENKNKELNDSLLKNTEVNTELQKTINELNITISNSNSKIDSIKNLIKVHYNWFNSKKIIDKIISFL